MIKSLKLREFCGLVFMMTTLMVVNSGFSIAQEQVSGFQGNYSSSLKTRMDEANARIGENLKGYKKDKSVAYLDDSYNTIMQSVDAMDITYKAALQQLEETPESAEMAKLKAQIDKLEVITVRDAELPYLCDQLYEVGRLYAKADKNKSKQCFRDIAKNFTSYESMECRRKAEYALKSMK